MHVQLIDHGQEDLAEVRRDAPPNGRSPAPALRRLQYTNITRVGTFQGDQPYVNLGYEPASDDEFVVYVSHTHPLYIPESALGLLACSMVLVCGAGVPSTADVQLMLKYHPGAYGEIQSADGKNYYFGFGISH
jgi:hypothetical protein